MGPAGWLVSGCWGQSDQATPSANEGKNIGLQGSKHLPRSSMLRAPPERRLGKTDPLTLGKV
eukprot:6102747-Alexandrium_andersonii.AAC.1